MRPNIQLKNKLDLFKRLYNMCQSNFNGMSSTAASGVLFFREYAEQQYEYKTIEDNLLHLCSTATVPEQSDQELPSNTLTNSKPSIKVTVRDYLITTSRYLGRAIFLLLASNEKNQSEIHDQLSSLWVRINATMSFKFQMLLFDNAFKLLILDSSTIPLFHQHEFDYNRIRQIITTVSNASWKDHSRTQSSLNKVTQYVSKKISDHEKDKKTDFTYMDNKLYNQSDQRLITATDALEWAEQQGCSTKP